MIGVDVTVLRVEPGHSGARVSLSTTEQHGIGALKVQHDRRPHVDTSPPLSAPCTSRDTSRDTERHCQSQHNTAMPCEITSDMRCA